MKWGEKSGEVVRALAVLALVFLNFAHAPLGAVSAAEDIVAPLGAASSCGSPVEDPQDHAPCHACRIGGGADLPPALPALAYAGAVTTAIFASVWSDAAAAAPIHGLGARAPPAP